MKNYVAFIVMACSSFSVLNAQQGIIPRPNVLTPLKGSFTLSATTTLSASHDSLLKQVDFFNNHLKKIAGFALPTGNKGGNKIALELKQGTAMPSGGYELMVSPGEIRISGYDVPGLFYGLNNLLFLLPDNIKPNQPIAIPAMIAVDAPRFGYRGMMLDVARHFRPVADVKKVIDRMALLKLNVFHWHLTEDQGWRIEIKKYPKLTEVAAWRDGTIIGGYPGTGNDNQKHGGYYTQEEVKEIVRYAAERHITVIPEIEMPGHSSAAIAAYPFLSCFPDEETVIPKHPSLGAQAKKGKKVQESWGVYEDVYAPTEETFAFLQDVIDEIIPLFPAKYIHIGGDECPKEAWKRSAFCQQLIKDKGLKDEHGLQSYFIQRMEKYINSKGKQIIGWDEILEGGLAPNATVMSWRGEDGGIEAAKQKHDVIMSPTTYAYLDYSQSKNEDSVVIGGYLPLEKVYGYDPLPNELKNTPYAGFVKGAQANVWTEYMRTQGKVEYMIFPRLAAITEAMWTMPENKNWTDFENRLPGFFNLLEKLNTNFSRAYYDIQPTITPNATRNGVNWHLKSNLKEAKIMVTAPGKPASFAYTAPIPVTASGTYKAVLLVNGKQIKPITQTFLLHKAVGRKVTLHNPTSPKYPGNGGFQGIVNGSVSNSGLKSSEWLGWEGGDMHLEIDLGVLSDVKKLVIHTIESRGSWIYYPKEVWITLKDEQGKTVQEIKVKPSAVEADAGQYAWEVPVKGLVKARFAKVKLFNHGMIASGMPGGGHKAWLFVDEIEVK